VAPRDLALSRPSPRGKKNSRGAPRLRQIKRGNSSLTQVRHPVIEHVRTVANWDGRETRGKGPASNRRQPTQTMASMPFPRERVLGGFISFEAIGLLSRGVARHPLTESN
jgi:hypothetical protein